AASAYVTWFDSQGPRVREQPLGKSLAPVRITGMAMDRDGATAVTGYFQGGVDFGGGEVSSAGLDDIFVARYEPDGSLGFNRTFGDASHQSGAGGLALDGEGNLFTTGSFRGTLNFGDGEVTNEGDEDVYLVKLSPAGDTLWSRTFGDFGHQEAAPIAVSPEGRVAIAGTFEGELDFGGNLLESTEGYHFNLFVAQLDADGEHRFSMRFGDVHAEEAIGLGFAPEGHLVLAGHFGGSMVIGDQGFVTEGAWDLFAVRFDQAGTPVASRQFGDQYAQRCEGLAVDPLGQVLITGTFEGALDFGHSAGPLTATPEDADGFVSRLSL
ncbi:MAG TPA: hypothetical protein VLS89_08545, partial [Candidatus Nanopelagicales bacterium]|nr:hypothetical protein [Candidatus Nanopelagicales bacterium]